MQHYQTVEEKASEWKLSIRHIQHLCRTGAIEGAIKRGGLWFVPDDVENPAKNTKTNGQDFDFIGTKKRIFEKAIQLFKQKGFDQISLKDIADEVGIQQSTIYNHFKSKQEILDKIYQFYCRYYLEDRRSLKEAEEKWNAGGQWQSNDIINVIQSVRYDFKEEYRQKMSDITIIVLHRIGIDERAREIAKSLMIDEGIRYVENVFQRVIDLGKLAPFDTHAIAIFINSITIFTLLNWIVAPSDENTNDLLNYEQILFQQAAKLLMNLAPGEKSKTQEE